MALSVLALRCGRCGEELRGLDGDRAFCCAPCATAWEVEDGRFVARPFRALEPVIGGKGERLWLPFWRLGVSVHAEGENRAACDALRAVAAVGRAWVRAFWLTSAFYVGDPGQRMTGAGFEERLRADALPCCAGTRLGSSEAMQLAELFLLAAADRSADITGVKAHFDFTERALVAVPFRLFEGDAYNMTDGFGYSPRALSDLAALRERARAT